MSSRILWRAAGVLMAAGIAGVVAAAAGGGPAPAAAGAIAIAAGGVLLWGGPRTALWVRTIAVFVLGAAVVAIAGAPAFQPPGLTIAEIRFGDPAFARAAAALVAAFCVALWTTLELGRPPVRDAIAGAGIRRWDMMIPAQAGGGIVLLAGFMLWLTVHGQSARLAEELALEQLGPEYQYHLSWISSTKTARGTSVSGIVTAWNGAGIKTVLLHWETR